jgi:phosphoglycerate dehydrogenase-like enzyme
MNVFRLTSTLDEYVDFYNPIKEEAEIIVVGGSKINLEEYPKLKYIFKCGVGVDNIPNLEGTGIKLVMPSSSTKKCIYDEVSDFTLYSILNAHYHNNGSVNGWVKIERQQLSKRKALVVGLGNIGDRVYRKLSVFMDTKGYDPFLPCNVSRIEDGVRESDIITLHCPLTSDNHGMINMNWLKEDSILVNTSRASLVNETELFDFLSSNPKAKAVFDVFWKEPYEGKLLELDNFIATPHVASMGDGFKKGLFNDLQELRSLYV